MQKTELLDELKPFLETSKGMPMLRHPLVYAIPFTPLFADHCNQAYLHKQKAVNEALAEQDWNHYIFTHERPYRVHAFCRIMHQLTDAQYWQLLRDVYTDTEFPYHNLDDYLILFTAPRPHRHLLMSEEEQALFASLPDRFTIYRGVSKRTHLGLSWTLSKAKAEWFANRWDKGKVLKRTLHRDMAIAYLNRRNEEEILYPPPELGNRDGSP